MLTFSSDVFKVFSKARALTVLCGSVYRKGTVRVFTRPPPGDNTPGIQDDPYWAVICSMGLMGIITEVTFNLLPKYKVLGSQLVWPVGPISKKMKSKYPVTWNDPKCRGEPQRGCCPCFGGFGRFQEGHYADFLGGDHTGPLDVYLPNDAKPPPQDMGRDQCDDQAESLKSLFVNHPHQTEYIRIWLWPQVDPMLWTIWKGHRALRKSENDDQGPSPFASGEYVDRNCSQWTDNFPFAEGEDEGILKSETHCFSTTMW